MMTCRRCAKILRHEDEVIAIVDGIYRRDSSISHSLDVHDEMSIEHRVCFFETGWRRVFRDIKEALQWR